MKIAAFIDGPNLFASGKGIGVNIDYKGLLLWLRGHGDLVRASYYTAITDGDEINPLRPLVDWLDYNGYSLVTKHVDMLEAAQYADQIFLFSGDGDFRGLIDAVQRKGVRVTVVSTLKSAPPMVADELRRQADEFIDLNDLKAVHRKNEIKAVA